MRKQQNSEFSKDLQLIFNKTNPKIQNSLSYTNSRCICNQITQTGFYNPLYKQNNYLQINEQKLELKFMEKMHQFYSQKIKDLEKELNQCVKKLESSIQIIKNEQKINDGLRMRLKKFEQQQSEAIEIYKQNVKKEFNRTLGQILEKKQKKYNQLKTESVQREKVLLWQNNKLQKNLEDLKTELNCIEKELYNYTNGDIN